VIGDQVPAHSNATDRASSGVYKAGVDREVAVDFEDYVHARGQSLVRFAYVLCGDPHMAEDLFQSALANAYRRWRRVAAADHPDAYVQRIVVNTYLSARRRRWTNELPASELLLTGAGPVASDVADDALAHDQFLQLVHQLPPRAKAVLVLRYYADLDDVAIADQLGVSLGTVRSTASRALSVLRQSEEGGTDRADSARRRSS
jgi:RNA polymerase sigma-70 factor (sigma-E family)